MPVPQTSMSFRLKTILKEFHAGGNGMEPYFISRV